jgi:predicted metalloprotease with PDZ domain
MIRDGSNNRRSLDDVMRELYRTTYKAGRGFTSGEWWGAVQRAAGIKSLTEFNAKYVDGREPYPWDRILPLAGLRLTTDTTQQARVGVSTAGLSDSGGVRINQVLPGSMAEEAGVQVGDALLSLGEVKVTENDFGPAYRVYYNSRPGESIDLVVRRGADTLKLPAKVRVVPEVEQKLELDPNAGEKAVRIRSGIWHGTVDR